MSSRSRLEITVHIGQTIQVPSIFVFAYTVKTLKLFTLLTGLFYLFVFGTEAISSDKGSIDISVIFKLLSSVKKIWK